MGHAHALSFSFVSSLIAAFALLTSALPAFAQTSVTACNQLVAETGVLAGDLDCSGSGNPSVTLANRASLDLNGFTITGGLHGVQCQGNCTVSGPGTLEGATMAGIIAANAVTATSVDILNNAGTGIYGARVSADGCTITGNFHGVVADKRVRLSNSNVSSNQTFGVLSYRLAKLEASTVSDNEYGVDAIAMTVSGSTLQDNEEFGVSGRGVKVADSTLTGNGLGDCDGTTGCADIRAARVSATNVICNTSTKTNWPSSTATGETLGICTND